MTIYDLLNKWISEANAEYVKAKAELNLYKMKEIQRIIGALRSLRNLS